MVECTRKKCDICKTTVAVKEIVRFRNIHPFVEMTWQDSDIFDRNMRTEMHICRECWLDLKDQVNIARSKRRSDNGN